MYVCMYIYMYVCMYIYVCMYVYICLYVYICMHVYVCMHIYVYMIVKEKKHFKNISSLRNHENNVPSRLSPQWPMALWQLMQMSNVARYS